MGRHNGRTNNNAPRPQGNRNSNGRVRKRPNGSTRQHHQYTVFGEKLMVRPEQPPGSIKLDARPYDFRLTRRHAQHPEVPSALTSLFFRDTGGNPIRRDFGYIPLQETEALQNYFRKHRPSFKDIAGRSNDLIGALPESIIYAARKTKVMESNRSGQAGLWLLYASASDAVRNQLDEERRQAHVLLETTPQHPHMGFMIASYRNKEEAVQAQSELEQRLVASGGVLLTLGEVGYPALVSSSS